MKYDDAKFLCREDEIVIKKTGEIAIVNKVEIYDKNVIIYVNTSKGYITLNHKEVG